MTDPKEFAAAMATAATKDREEGHSRADSLMVKLLVELGYAEAMDIYVAMDKWYA